MKKIKINSRDIYKYSDVVENIKEEYFDFSGLFAEALKEAQSEEIADNAFKQIMEGESKAIFFVGYKNTGKTEYLKKFFNIKDNSPYIQHQSNQIVIPAFNTGIIEEILPHKIVSDSIRGVCEKILLEYPEAKSFYKDEEIEKFYRFILDTQAETLPELNFNEECSMTELERKKERIAKMQQERNLSYQVLRLKFLILNYCLDLDKILILVDNLNNIADGCDKIKEVVNEYLEVYECLKNPANPKLDVYIVISVRPVIYRQLKESDRINAYVKQNNVIQKNYKIDTAKLFEKIGEVATEGITVDSETLSYGTSLYQLGSKFKYKYANMIEQLCFYDFDLMINAYKRILFNVTWIKNGNFRFSSGNAAQKGWSFNNITCIRALACGNRKLYRNMIMEERADSLDCLIPNLLYNTEEQNYGVLILYTMKYFLRVFEPEMGYGDSYILLKNYRNLFFEIFGSDGEEKYKEVINYLYRCEILRKSIADDNNIQDSFGESKFKEKIGWESKVYITSRGRKLWDMLRDDSLLLELCREDIYRTFDKLDNRAMSSYDLMINGEQNILFKDLLFIISQVFDEEVLYLEKVCEKNKKELFREAFGKSPLALTLLSGVNKSIRYSGSNELMDEAEKLRANITEKWNKIMGQ